MSATKPEIEIHSAPQGIKLTDGTIDNLVNQILDRLIQRVDMWEGRLGSRIGEMEVRVSLVVGGYQDTIDSLCRDENRRGDYHGHESFTSFPYITEERRLDGSLIPWSSGS